MSADTCRSHSPSPVNPRKIRRVAILFAGGPAPAANAVISTAAAAFLRNGIEVVGILNGYSHLVEFGPDHPMQEGRDYIVLDQSKLRRTRNTRGIMIGTARTNPGKDVSHPSHLADAKRTAALATVHQALSSLGVDALVSIGGDDTLKTANKFKMFQDHLPPASQRIAVVHVPKTIDNDYQGIDFTFGYFTAVETLANEIRNLLADAEATRGYFIAECMGRSAGWLAYGAAIAGEASLVLSVEDIDGEAERRGDAHRPQDRRQTSTRKIMDIDKLVDVIVRAMLAREAEGKEFGVIVLAEGLAQFLPAVVPGRGQVRRARPHLAGPDQPRADHGQGGRGRVREADRQETPADRPPARLRGALLPAPRLRRHPRQPARRRGLSGPGRERPRRRHGLVLGPAQPQLRPVREPWSTPRPWSPSSASSSPAPTSTAWPGSWKFTRPNSRGG